jgi:hypothetical protein
MYQSENDSRNSGHDNLLCLPNRKLPGKANGKQAGNAFLHCFSCFLPLSMLPGSFPLPKKVKRSFNSFSHQLDPAPPHREKNGDRRSFVRFTGEEWFPAINRQKPEQCSDLSHFL